MLQTLKLIQQPQLRTIILETQGVTLELHKGSYGYFTCYGCDPKSKCESFIEWEAIFCMVCPKFKSGTCDKPRRVRP